MGRDQVMHESVVIGPTADAVEPGLEQLEFAVAKLTIESLQQEHGGNFFFEDGAGEKIVGCLDQKVETVFFPHFAPETNARAAQVRCIPSVGFDFILKNHWTPLACSTEPPFFSARRISAATGAGVVLS